MSKQISDETTANQAESNRPIELKADELERVLGGSSIMQEPTRSPDGGALRHEIGHWLG